MPLPSKPFYMIRHGQTEANAARTMAGSLDSPLTALGRSQAVQARQVVEALAIKPTAIFHSNLSRARDTAALINKKLSLPMHEDKDLAEMYAGDFEGAPYEICEELFNSWPTPPNGETPNNFFERVKRGKIRALESSNDPVLIVCHGGVMRAFGALYGLDTPGIFKNAHLYHFTPRVHETFPWTVIDYSLCEKSKTLITNSQTPYD